MEGKNVTYDGKIMLIKAVDRVILTYVIRVLKLPENFYKDMNGLIRNYWRGRLRKRKE